MPLAFDLAIFDLDGTLADTAPDIERALNKAMADFGRPPIPREQVLRAIGPGGTAFYEAILPGSATEVAEEVVRRYREYYTVANAVHTRPFPGIVESLEHLRDAGVRMVVASNKPQPQSAQIVRGLGLARYFDGVFGPEDVERPKPEPDMLALAMNKCDVEADRAVMFGDTVNDMAAGRSAGATTAFVSWGYAPLEHIDPTLVDLTVERPSDVARIVEGNGAH